MLIIFHVDHDVVLLPHVGEVEHVMRRGFAHDVSRRAIDDVHAQAAIAAVDHRLWNDVQMTAARRATLFDKIACSCL